MLAGILMLLMFWRAWRTQRTQATILVASTVAVVLFFSQALLGRTDGAGFPGLPAGLHQATAVAVWAALVIQLVAVGLAGAQRRR